MVLPLKGLKENGGETGIRTLDTLRYTRFPSVRLQPLGHLSAIEQLFESTTLGEARWGSRLRLNCVPGCNACSAMMSCGTLDRVMVGQTSSRSP